LQELMFITSNTQFENCKTEGSFKSFVPYMTLYARTFVAIY